MFRLTMILAELWWYCDFAKLTSVVFDKTTGSSWQRHEHQHDIDIDTNTIPHVLVLCQRPIDTCQTSYKYLIWSVDVIYENIIVFYVNTSNWLHWFIWLYHRHLYERN
jgi:hypothetical protein